MKVRWKLACLLFAITIFVSIKYSQNEMSLKYENDVYVSNEDEDENMHQINKRDTNSNQDILKTYIKNLKNVRLFFFMIYRLRIDLILNLKKRIKSSCSRVERASQMVIAINQAIFTLEKGRGMRKKA
jgi:capsular polysaccharide biosynthesis protein